MKTKIQTYLLEANQPLWRVHHKAYKAAAFNDSGCGDARFSPLKLATTESQRDERDERGEKSEIAVYPTLYAANQYQDAFAETIMRKQDSYASQPSHQKITEHTLGNYLLSVIHPVKSVLLADLDDDWVPPIIAAGLKQSQADGIYPLLREFALRLIANNPNIQGLKWCSYQQGAYGQSAGQPVYLLINHPNMSAPIEVAADRYSTPLLAPGIRDKIKECAMLTRYVLPEHLL